MSILVESLNELSVEAVQAELAVVSNLLQEFNPEIDVRRGVLYSLLLKNAAIFGAKNQEEFARLQRSQSLLAANADPELADDAILDAIASNYRVTRKAGTAAYGEITIVVSVLAPLVIAAGALFVADGEEYVTETSFAARTSAENVSLENDRVLNPTADGNYSFSIPVVAARAAAIAVPKDTLFEPDRPPVNFVRSFAAADFFPGQDTESNASLIGRLLEGIAARTLSGRVNMFALLRDQADFSAVIASSVIGFGDQEMLRDQHSLFPGSFGSRVDWYLRTAGPARRVGLRKTATLYSKNADGTGVWQFSVGRDEAPGFYDFPRIVPADSTAEGTFPLVSDERSFNLTELDSEIPIPDIVSPLEAVYSRFQTATIRFQDTETLVGDLTVGESSRNYDVTVRGMPLLAEIQDWVSQRGIASVNGDILIKAPIPCFLSISFTLQMAPGQDPPDQGELTNALVSLVNNYGFTGIFPASAITGLIHTRLSGAAHVSAIDMLADIRRPNGVIRRIRSSEEIVVPTESAQMLSGRTVGFITSAESIAISVAAANISDV